VLRGGGGGDVLVSGYESGEVGELGDNNRALGTTERPNPVYQTRRTRKTVDKTTPALSCASHRQPPRALARSRPLARSPLAHHTMTRRARRGIESASRHRHTRA